MATESSHIEVRTPGINPTNPSGPRAYICDNSIAVHCLLNEVMALTKGDSCDAVEGSVNVQSCLIHQELLVMVCHYHHHLTQTY
jgi:hypothetical protein